MYTIKRGLDIPVNGAPVQEIKDTIKSSRVALVGSDHVGMKPTMLVKIGEKVAKGQTLFTDKKNPKVNYTSPSAGKVVEINRGAKRIFQSIVIEVQGEDHVSFCSYKGNSLSAYSREEMISLLLESGMWTAFRTRPFSKTPTSDSTPSSIFITAMDSNALSADPVLAINIHEAAFNSGLQALSLLSNKLHLCKKTGSKISVTKIENLKVHEFSGPHPSGLAGTHIHYIDPVSASKTVWTIGYQDVIAIGKLIESGQIFTERIVALAGPVAKNPRLIKTELGACLKEITKEEVDSLFYRVVSGSLLSGRNATTSPFCYLGRYHNQICLIEEGTQREFLGWQGPGFDKFSVTQTYLGKFVKKLFPMTTSTHGSLRAMVPIGNFEKIMPLDIIPNYLLRALLSKDTDSAQRLGCLELDEEDLGLCDFVCSSKINYQSQLRESLTTIEKEG